MLSKNLRALIYGNLTNDLILVKDKSYLTPGGAGFYTARTLSNLNTKVTLVSPYGTDFPKNKLPGINFIPNKPNTSKTLRFINSYHSDGTRTQIVENYKKANLLLPDDIDDTLLKNKEILIVAPVINNISSLNLEKLSSIGSFKLKVLIPQGLFRKIDNFTVKSDCCDYPTRIFKNFDIIVVSEKDFPGINDLAKEWGSGNTMTIVTRSFNPASVYYQGSRVDYPAFKSPQSIDETGAGDIFAAAFTFAYYKSQNIENSINFAHAAALLSLPLTSDQLKYGYQDIIDIAAKQKRVINL